MRLTTDNRPSAFVKLSSTAKLRMINDMPSTMRAWKDLPTLPNLLEGAHADLSPRLTFAQLSGVLVPSRDKRPGWYLVSFGRRTLSPSAVHPFRGEECI